MMQSFTPADVSVADTLLAIIAHPKAAKAALDDLVKAKAEHDGAAANAKAEREQARIDSDAAEEKIALAVATIDNANRFTVDEKRKLDVRTMALEDRAEQLNASKAELAEARRQHQQRVVADQTDADARKREQDNREKRLETQEQSLAAREASVAEAESKANALIADYTNRIAKLVSMAKGGE